MEENIIKESNKLIAKFMNIPCSEFHEFLVQVPEEESPWSYDPIPFINYDSNWSQLMSVVEKIEEIGASVYIQNDLCYITPNH
jgi:hypothetical protein